MVATRGEWQSSVPPQLPEAGTYIPSECVGLPLVLGVSAGLPSIVVGSKEVTVSEVNVTIQAGFSEESARRYLSAFRTIIEASINVINKPERMLIAYSEYFMPIVDDIVERGEVTREEAMDIAKAALSELFIINQRLAYMVGTEVAEEIGAEPIDPKDMAYPIDDMREGNEPGPLSQEEVMEELSRIMRQQNGGSN